MKLASLTALTDAQIQKTEAISNSPMRTRTKHMVALMPPIRFREEKAAEKAENLLREVETKLENFRKPKGRPIKDETNAP